MGQEGGRLTLSDKEWRRVETVRKIEEGRLTQALAAEELGLSVRQVKRLCRRLREEGKAGLACRHRGRPSNRRLAPEVIQQAVLLLQAHYPDFGPTLAHEKLIERHGLELSVESVRQLMIVAKLHRPRPQAQWPVHQPRERRQCYGELVQIDGSPHDWFEGRAPSCSLLLFVDDATGRWQWGSFVAAETTLAYMAAIRGYSLAYGKPRAFYSDRHSIFRINSKNLVSAEGGHTQLARALQELGVQLICAHSPQAKGRIERGFQTAQDRLVKEMRLAGINDWTEGNAFLPAYLEQINRQFAVAPQAPHDLHQPVTTKAQVHALTSALTVQEQRKLGQQLTCSLHNTIYQLQPTSYARRLRGVKVDIQEHPDGHLTIAHQGRDLLFQTIRSQPRQAQITDSKTLASVLAPEGSPLPRLEQRRPSVATSVRLPSTSSASPRPNNPWRKNMLSPRATIKSQRRAELARFKALNSPADLPLPATTCPP